MRISFAAPSCGAARRRLVRGLSRGLGAVVRHGRSAGTKRWRAKGGPFSACASACSCSPARAGTRGTPGLGWITGEVDQIKPRDAKLKIPHMGWNTLNVLRTRIRCLRDCRWVAGDCTHISCTSFRAQSVAAAGFDRRRRLWRADHRDCRPRHCRRYTDPSGEEPAARGRVDRQLFEVEAVIFFPASTQGRRGRAPSARRHARATVSTAIPRRRRKHSPRKASTICTWLISTARLPANR